MTTKFYTFEPWHGITFRFRLFMECFSFSRHKNIKFTECVMATELSRFIFPRVSVSLTIEVTKHDLDS